MFKIADDDTKIIKSRPVVINIPGDGGAITKADITADFIILPQSEIDDLIAASREVDGDADILRKVWCGWSGVQDASGNTLDYSEAARDKLLDITYVRSALLQAYFKSASGEKAQRKN